MSSKPGKFGNRTRRSKSQANGPGSALTANRVPETKAPDNKNLSHTGATKYGTKTCEVCGLEVRLLKSGALGAHWVGQSRKQGWPCPGSSSYDTSTSTWK